MGTDQCHKQLNRTATGDGGASVLSEDNNKLRGWVTCEPEVTRLVREYKDIQFLRNIDSKRVPSP